MVSSDKPLIMIVGMPDSVHLARWTHVARGNRFRIVVLPIYDAPVSDVAQPFAPISEPDAVQALPADTIGVLALTAEAGFGERTDIPGDWPPDRMRGLISPRFIADQISAYAPTIVHSLETQLAGYRCLAAKSLCERFPIWMHSNWGSDIFLFRKIDAHRPVLFSLLEKVDAYTAECGRDLKIARQMGFKGLTFAPIPASGGDDVDGIAELGSRVPPSRRRQILVKGYHGWSGRGMHVLSALQLAAHHLADYRIRIRLASPEIAGMADALSQSSNLKIEIDPYFKNHGEALSHLADARMVIGSSISDGISTTLLEAMSVGAYPIQTCASCADEWIRNGLDGAIVSPHDTSAMASAIIRAASDDELVDNAAKRNLQYIRGKWDKNINKKKVIGMYQNIIQEFNLS